MASIKGYLEEGISFVKESWVELSKVHFPSPKETMQATLVVVLLTVIVALWLGLIDMGASRIVRQLVS
ncbi:MAG: preprotein translocase subunit SecE [Candidatus Binataceae bacterium]|jgi:preprotein translocase subunit SecE